MTAATISPRRSATYVHQGTFSVSENSEEVLTTVLGSCVATCLFDPHSQVGGMNHFLLPSADSDRSGSRLYGVNLMELLINNLMRMGAERSNLKAKLFGGGMLNGGVWDIGERNAIFARKFLSDESIPCVGESLGGPSGRRIRFWPTTGRAQQNMLDGYEEKMAPPTPKEPPDIGEVELF